jgi:hypothetical protein
MLYFHDGHSDFPHGAGASDPGWYFYPDGDTSRPEPLGPFDSAAAATSAGYHFAQFYTESRKED